VKEFPLQAVTVAVILVARLHQRPGQNTMQSAITEHFH